MSYCRWSEDSDIYMYNSVGGGIVISLIDREVNDFATTRSGAIAVLKQAMADGLKVPGHVLHNLENDLKEFGETDGIEIEREPSNEN